MRYLPILILLTLGACQSNSSTTEQVDKVWCGYEMTEKDYEIVAYKGGNQPNAYYADKENVFSQIEKKLKSIETQDTTVKIFMTYYSQDEIAITVTAKKNETYFNKLGCCLMKMSFEHLPQQVYFTVYDNAGTQIEGHQQDFLLVNAIKKVANP